MPAIRTKNENLRLWTAGKFGNTLRVWQTLDDALADLSYEGPYVVRSRKATGLCVYRIAGKVVLSYMNKTHNVADSYVNEQMPDDLITIQGELRRDEEGLYLFYNETPNLHMREALKQAPKQAHGLAARMLLQKHLQGYADVLWGLLDEYQDHIIEFSAFSKPIGTRGWPLIVWEVRRY